MKTLTFGEACNIVAKKYELGTTLVTGHREKYWTEAAEIYAQSAKAEAWDAGMIYLWKENIEGKLGGRSVPPHGKNPYKS